MGFFLAMELVCWMSFFSWSDTAFAILEGEHLLVYVRGSLVSLHTWVFSQGSDLKSKKEGGKGTLNHVADSYVTILSPGRYLLRTASSSILFAMVHNPGSIIPASLPINSSMPSTECKVALSVLRPFLSLLPN